MGKKLEVCFMKLCCQSQTYVNFTNMAADLENGKSWNVEKIQSIFYVNTF